ncbi:MAG: glycosyltransferase [Leptolyngbyaceae cyanobacterium]
MSRIILTTWGSLGDLHPMIALSLRLRDRGHAIVLAAPENHRAKVESLGLPFHALRPELPIDPQMIERVMDPQTGPEIVLKELVLGHVRNMYDDLMAIAKDADFLIAHEIVYAAPAVAEVLKLRWATCTLAPATFFSAYEPVVTSVYPAVAQLYHLGPLINRWVINFAKLITHPWGKPLYQLRKELGLAPIQNPIVGNDKYSPHLVLALFSSLFGKPQPDWPPHTVTTGFTFYDGKQEQSLSPELDAFLHAGSPPLVFTLGSAAVKVAGDFYAESAQAAIKLGHRAVLLLGENAPPSNLPANIFTSGYEPYSDLFPRARVIVHQGGIGTTAQALRAGRPTLITPYSHDQPDNAMRALKLGTSRTIERQQYAASRVAEELRILTETPNYMTEAAAVGRLVRAEKGIEAACDAIEKQLAKAAVML